VPQTDRAYLSGGLAGKVAMRAATRAILVSASVLTSMLLGYRIGMAAKPSHCPKDCKQDIKNCLALVLTNKACTGTKAEKKACRKMHAVQRKACHGLVKLCKQQNPSMSGTCLPSSTTTSRTLSAPALSRCATFRGTGR